MGAELHRNDAGTWRRIVELHFNDAGTWRKIKEAFYNDAGTWRRFFGGILNAAFGISLQRLGNPIGTYTASITFNSDGSTTVFNGATFAGPDWFTPQQAGIGTSYWIKIHTHNVVGGVTYGGSIPRDTWTQLTAGGSFSVANSITTAETTGQFDIAYSTDGGLTTALNLVNAGDWEVGRSL